MKTQRLGCLAVLGFVTAPAFAQWESGSDGSDGAFHPAVSTQVDLALAASLCDCDGDTQVDDPCRWDCPSPVPGRGVYDAEQWVVVYKYSTVNVASGATITFAMHPSGAPVAWLATGGVTISGRVNVDGEDAVNINPSVIPYFSRPGPGGFEGGQPVHPGASGLFAYGFGPGSSPTSADGHGGLPSYAAGTPGCGGSTGQAYGNSEIIPLIGGSGGSQAPGSPGFGGGAGGGAVLIVSPTQVIVASAGSITAEGGARLNTNFNASADGSGGAIRLRAHTVTLASGSQLVSRGGGFCGSFSHGRVRIEANSITNGATISGIPSIVNAPSVVFPAAAPQLYVTNACGQPAPADPQWGIMTTDIDLNSGSSCTVNIEGRGMPVGSIVTVRLIPARGSIVSVNSTPMVDAGGGLRTATATVNFPGGRSEIQLRANW